MKKLLPIALLLCGACATAVVTARALVPTLYIANLTDDQVNVTMEGRTIARVPMMGTACVHLTNLPTREVTISFRALAHPSMAAQPTNYEAAEGWYIRLTGASHDGGFFASPAERCR